MIKKCDFKGCNKLGTCRAPKSSKLNEYWYFCPFHASEYNKNWNFYSNMSKEEIDKDYEYQIFGDFDNNPYDFLDFINNSFSNRTNTIKNNLPKKVIESLKELNLDENSNFKQVSAKYRELAKIYHPDKSNSNDTEKFSKITSAYNLLKEYFNKK